MKLLDRLLWTAVILRLGLALMLAVIAKYLVVVLVLVVLGLIGRTLWSYTSRF